LKTLIIDNYDSFTYNLFQLVAEVNGEEPLVITNDQYDLSQLHFDNIIISPGPGHPDNPADFGVCEKVLQECDVPILGICLGHQGLCSVFGGQVVHAPVPMHGQISRVRHFGDAIFAHIPEEFNVVRYHSLMVAQPLPDCLEVIATTFPDIVMGIRHRSKPFWGVQYHPESICSEYGLQLLQNFKTLTYQHQQTITHKIDVRKLNVWREPEAIFNQLYANQKNVVWLDSSLVVSNSARFSFMGGLDGPLSYALEYDTHCRTVVCYQSGEKKDVNLGIFDYLQQELSRFKIPKMDLPFDFHGGFVGYLGYELYAETLPIPNVHRSAYPDAQFLFLDRVLVFDHQEQVCYLVAVFLPHHAQLTQSWFEEMEDIFSLFNDNACELPDELSEEIPYKLSRSRETYIKDIRKCMHHIRNGDSYEICLTNKVKINHLINADNYYRTLRRINPAPYAAFLKFADMSIACASVERFLKIDTAGHVESKPIKGTLPRGSSVEEDLENRQLLQRDIKFKSENLMIVDLLRNDLGKVCEIGSVHVPKLMDVESYATVHQLVSTIRGKLRSNKTAIDCIKSTFPGGSMTGAPKIRTMEIIHQLEQEARNIYSGAIGYLSLNGAIDLNIVIRTAVIHDEMISIGVGGAIIALSDPEAEFDEIILKSKALRKALFRG
jgi:para-aminobenzoate synthetase